MKKVLLILGILLIVAGVLSLAFSGLTWYTYKHLLDASADHYRALERQALVSLLVGLGLAVLGIVAEVLRARL